jgi:nucleoside-diphosphate-sugar epimerase
VNRKLQTVIITGASGFIGKYLLESLKEEFIIYAIARRSRMASNVPYHKNIRWLQCDIGNSQTVEKVTEYLKTQNGADFLIHLAAYYDFEYSENAEYERTNIQGTKNILQMAREIPLKRFIFASSLAAIEFPKGDEIITEKSLPNATFAYARSKRTGEAMVQKAAAHFPCSVLRFAAVFSDWCEYAPLYKMLNVWLSKKLDSRILGGKGESAIPYLHVNDLISLFQAIMRKSEKLPAFDIYNASPDGSVSHRQLYQIATVYHYGRNIRPWYIPKFLVAPGLLIRKAIGFLHITADEPFEKLWMVRYIDRKLNIDASCTRNALDWEPAPRNHISRRILFLLEKMKSHPDEWRLKNEAALNRVARHSNLMIYEALISGKDAALERILSEMQKNENKARFAPYQKLDSNDFQCYMSALYHLLMATVRSGDRSLMLQYIDDIATRRFAEGFEPKILCNTLAIFKDIIIDELTHRKELSKIRQDVYDYIGLTLQLAQDEIEDLYDRLIAKLPAQTIDSSALLPDCKELQRVIRQLSAVYQISPDENGQSQKQNMNNLSNQ